MTDMIVAGSEPAEWPVVDAMALVQTVVRPVGSSVPLEGATARSAALSSTGSSSESVGTTGPGSAAGPVPTTSWTT